MVSATHCVCNALNHVAESSTLPCCKAMSDTLMSQQFTSFVDHNTGAYMSTNSVAACSIHSCCIGYLKDLSDREVKLILIIASAPIVHSPPPRPSHVAVQYILEPLSNYMGTSLGPKYTIFWP